MNDVNDPQMLQRWLVDSVTAERQAIGRELHDGVAQELHGITMLAAALQKRLETASRPEAEEVGELVTLIGSAQSHLRAIIAGVRPLDVDEEELEDALHKLAATKSRRYAIKCTVEGRLDFPLTQTEATELFYIAGEAATNAAKHSGCTRIRIKLGRRNNHPTMCIEDDGQWTEAESGGMGLKIMRYRADLIGAELSVARGSRSGTEIVCMLDEDSSGSEE